MVLLYERLELMGWDAYSEPFTGFKHGLGQDRMNNPDPAYLPAVVAARRNRTDDGTIDGLLQHGGLDCSNCCQALEAALPGVSCYGDDWTSEQVKVYVKTAAWDRAALVTEEWAWRSAKAFLERTAELDRGVHFSW